MTAKWNLINVFVVFSTIVWNVGGNRHPETGEFCAGNRQSPIDVTPDILTTVNYPALYWGKGFFMEPLTQEVIADSHSVVLRSTFAETPYIGGGPLKECYKLHSIHFHWATTDDKGSEHTLNGKSYPMEMHVVMTKGNLTLDEARNTPDGITVLGYFIDILPYSEEPRTVWNPFAIMTKTLTRIQFVHMPQSVIKFFEMSNLTILFHFNYITYEGSLTTGACNEVVTWIISPKILKISRAQMEVFRNLHSRSLMAEAENYRDVQPLNNRQVFFVKDRPHGL